MRYKKPIIAHYYVSKIDENPVYSILFDNNKTDSAEKQKNEIFQASNYNEETLVHLEEIDKILFEYEKEQTEKELEVTKQTFINDTLFWFYEVDKYKLFLNPNKIHLLDIFKTKLINIIKDYYWKKISDIYEDLKNTLEDKLNTLKAEEEANSVAKNLTINFTEKNNKLIREYEIDKFNKTKLNNEAYTEKINYINSNIFFEYLVNLTLIKAKNNPTNIDFEYQASKQNYETLLDELLLFVENDINFNKDNGSGKNSFIDFINKITKSNNLINYDINQAISKLELMHYIEQSDYLKLLSKYSKLNDVYLKLNSLEDEIGLPRTNKPIILIVIENLFINSQSNVTYDIDNNNISTIHQGFGNNKNMNIYNNNDNNNNNNNNNTNNNTNNNNKKIIIIQKKKIIKNQKKKKKLYFLNRQMVRY